MEAVLGHNSLSLQRLRSTPLLKLPCTLDLPLQPPIQAYLVFVSRSEQALAVEKKKNWREVAEQRLASAPEEGLLSAQDLHGARRVLGQVG